MQDLRYKNRKPQATIRHYLKQRGVLVPYLFDFDKSTPVKLKAHTSEEESEESSVITSNS
jgi:hypothetical protein